MSSPLLTRRTRRPTRHQVEREQAEDMRHIATELAVAALLSAQGFDPAEHPGLTETPARVARMYTELLTPRPFKFTVFEAEGADQLILERGITFYSLCEHHMVPFFGTATVAYIPNGKIAGLSKLARAVEFYARGLQTQERITNQVADLLVEKLDPVGVGVVLQATHLCMAMRGVQKPGTLTVTSALRGALRDKPEARAEFLSLAYGAATQAQG